TWERDLRFDPVAAGAVPFHFTGFHWNLDLGAAAEHVVGSGTDTLTAVITLAAHSVRKDAPSRADLQILVRNGQGQERILERVALTRASGDTVVERLSVPATGMPFGPLVFTARIIADDGASLDLMPGREFVNLAVPWDDEAAWRRHVGWLEMIVDGDRRRTLAGTSPAGRPAAWREVWRERPPDARPVEREHLMRIVEADRRFGRFGRGALSDQGRIFIFNGEPDRIETLEMDATYPGAWQIWYYRGTGLLYRFYDAYGMGDYRLYDTAPY
ncbi:GWxTD domain-containing protein, partial [bacterium]|nr:GWxTD domain-containing protein [bacterium]